MVDRRRRTVPISGTRIRRDPIANLALPERRSPCATTSSACCLLGRREHGQDDACARTRRALRHGLESGVRPCLLVVPRARRERLELVDDGRVHPDRADAELVRGLPRRAGERRSLLRHERVDDRPLPRDLPRASARPRSTRSRAASTTSTSCATRRRPFAQDELGMRTDGPHRRRMHEAYLAHLREIGAPFVVVSGSACERMRAGGCGRRRATARQPADARTASDAVELAHAEQAADPR